MNLNLLDQLMSEIEHEEEEEITPPSFALDDLTVEVSQYGDGEEIILDRKPDFDSIAPSEEDDDEEYELTQTTSPNLSRDLRFQRIYQKKRKLLSKDKSS